MAELTAPRHGTKRIAKQAITPTDFLSSVARRYPRALAAPPDWLREIIANAGILSSSEGFLDFPTFFYLPRGIAHEITRTGDVRLALPIEKANIRTPAEELRIHARAVTLAAEIVKSGQDFIESTRTLKGLHKWLNIDPRFATRARTADMLADHVVGRMSYRQIANAYHHGESKKLYTAKAVENMLRQPMRDLGITSARNRVLNCARPPLTLVS